MFAFLIVRLPAPLRRALAYAKAFVFLEEPPAALPGHRRERARPAAAAGESTPRERGLPRAAPPSRHGRRPASRHPDAEGALLRPRSGARARRTGAVARSKQPCRTPTHRGASVVPAADRADRRAGVSGGFLH